MSKITNDFLTWSAVSKLMANKLNRTK